MPLALSTGHEIGLCAVALAFVGFALLSALVIPRRWPGFPGRNLRWFVVATLVFFVAMLAAVEIFAKEPSESEAQEPTTETRATTGEQPAPPPPAEEQGDPAAGKSLFAAQGCGACHAFKAANASGAVGPDLDEALAGKDAEFVGESIVEPNKEIASGYQPNVMPQNFGQTLSPKEVDDLVAFLLNS